jgi:predicted ATP-dependent endonuclease of OLD family
MPLSINLRDKSVEVPIGDWGSGTQNRTHILMAVLKANRIKTTTSTNEKITPLVVIEEPESFLHPSAQAEFGRILRHLSNEFGIQIVVTTHSPYMLNQEEPGSNILLSRETRKGKLAETVVINTEAENWMAPFADHLGINAHEFSTLRPIFSADRAKALLVEGPIDRDYFLYLQNNELECERLSSDIEISPYGGKDTLKNTVLLKFVLGRFDRVFVTYDLDCATESCTALARAGIRESDHAAVGLSQGGRDCIEGLLPSRVLAAVNGRETDLVMKLGSNSDRRSAKEQLKKKYLEEFKSRTDYTVEELDPINKIIKKINVRLRS